ncbi:MAG: putative tricarboxylic transport membrane protein [Alphaproteobacteria bacterium]|jgi:putative tricarboxylic transport membrane protein
MQDDYQMELNRRRFLMGSVATLAAGIMSSGWIADAAAAGFPSKNIRVYVPTRQGGGADRNLRLVTTLWKDILKINFEPAFYPGAAGRVAYETYMGKASGDGHDLIFGNMGPEVLNWVVKKPTFPLDAYRYFFRVDEDPSMIFVGKRSKLKTIDDIVAEGKKRTVNFATSRIAHPATIGVLALGKATGASFNPIPLSGGRNTRNGVATGEIDFGALPAGGMVVQRKNFKMLLLFADKNVLGEKAHNAPTVNDKYGTKLPPLVSARAFGIKTEVIEKYPDRMKVLEDTLRQVVALDAFKKAVIKAKAPWELISPGGQKECAEYVKSIVAIGNEYRDLLRGAEAKAKAKKKKGKKKS